MVIEKKSTICKTSYALNKRKDSDEAIQHRINLPRKLWLISEFGESLKSVIKMIDNNGNHLWQTTFSKNDSAWNELAGFVIDNNGNMYAALTSQNYPQESVIAILKYNRPFPVKVE